MQQVIFKHYPTYIPTEELSMENTVFFNQFFRNIYKSLPFVTLYQQYSPNIIFTPKNGQYSVPDSPHISPSSNRPNSTKTTYFLSFVLNNHHIRHFLTGFIQDSAGQLKTSANSGMFCRVPMTLNKEEMVVIILQHKNMSS